VNPELLKTAYARRVYALLKDGSMVSLQHLISEGAKVVPERHAYLKAQKDGTRGSYADMVSTGARALVRDGLWHYLQRGSLEEVQVSGRTLIRFPLRGARPKVAQPRKPAKRPSASASARFRGF
jgi:hypothetical protein